MDKTECIKRILSDKDLVKRVKEWMSRREEIQQASLAASMDLKKFLASLPMDEFDQMIQDLDIERAVAASRSQPSSQKNRGGLASDQDVPKELNDDKGDDDDVEWENRLSTAMSSNSKTTSIEPEIKAPDHDVTMARTSDVPSAHHAVFNVFDNDEEDEDEELKTEDTRMASAWNFPPPPDEKKVHGHRNHENSHPEKEVNMLPPTLTSTVTEIKDSQTSDCSNLESFRAEEAESNQNSVEYEAIPRSTSSMSDSAESYRAFNQTNLMRQPSLEASDRSAGGSSDESPSVGPPSRTWTEEPASDSRATEHASAVPGEDLHHSDRPSVSNYQHSRGPRTSRGPENENLGDARESNGFPGENPPQLPAGMQNSAPQTVGQLQNLNSPQLNLQNPSQIRPETLHALVMMLNRELIRRGNQPARCDSCTNLQAEVKHLRKSCQCLGQQLELLKWNYILLEEIIKNLEEVLKQKDNDNVDNIRIIQYFHEKLVERKNELSNLKKEIEVMRNKFEQERKQIYERVDEEGKNQSQVCEQMKNQTEMLERVNENVSAVRQEKQVLQEKLKKKSEESSEMEKENESLKEENKVLKEKLKTSETLRNQLMLAIQALEEEKRKEREANQVLQDEYICRETQFSERINSEVKQLMELFDNLQTLAKRHGFFSSLPGLNFERENDDNSPPC